MKHPIHNPGSSPMYVAGVLIPPGETMHFDTEQLPPEHQPKAPEPVPEEVPDLVAEIHGMSAPNILKVLPDLSFEDLARLRGMEEAGKNRKTVIEGIAVIELKRAESIATAITAITSDSAAAQVAAQPVESTQPVEPLNIGESEIE